jgi:phage antirepressor YoqD-like protein
MIELVVDEFLNKKDQFFSIGEVAKFLMLKEGKKILGRNNLISVLRYNRILLPDNSPNQSFVSLGMAHYYITEKKFKSFGVTLFNMRGINNLRSGFKEGRYVIEFDKKNKKIKNNDEIF